MTRKEFLRKSIGIGIGASLFPMVAHSNPLGANRRIRTAVIGCGLMSRGHRRNVSSHQWMELVALCDVKSDMLEGAMEGLEDDSVRGYLDYTEILERDDIDAVVITTPDHWHAAMAIDAMRSGKDVYVEKPIALTIHEAAAIEAAEKRYGRVLQVGSQQRSNGAFRRAAEIVRNGWIGNVREVHCLLGRFPEPGDLPEQPIPETIDYDRWLGPAPWQPFNETRVEGNFSGGWRMFWDYGNRKLGDFGAHHFDIVQWALGKDESGPTRFYPRGYEGNPDEHFEYADGIKVYRDTPKVSQQARIVFVGDEGEVRVGRGNFLATTPSHLARRPLSSGETLLYRSGNHFQDWIDCMVTRRKPICSANVGRRTLDVCALTAIARRLERPITWDPQKAMIVGDPEAWEFSNYPRREGYPLPS